MGNCFSSKPNKSPIDSENEDYGNSREAIKFTLKELREYSDDFNRRNLVGHGDFGPVYRGTIRGRKGKNINGLDIAVKYSHTKDERSRTLWAAEIEYLPKVEHKNIIELIGYCETEDRFYLVYPFMPNGTLFNHLQDLNWSGILKIIKGIASGIQKLHEHNPSLVHGNLNLKNILLDKDFTPKLADFGTVTPEGKQSKSADIYNMGEIILQLIMKEGNPSLPGVHESIPYHISDRARNMFEQRGDAVHDSFKSTATNICSKKTITKLGLDCVHPDPSERPSIAHALRTLSNLC